MAKTSYLAVDMGASSGRHILGQFDGERIELEEIYRYVNGPIEMNDGYYWDFPGLWADVRKGLMAAAQRCGDTIKSVGVDTWGVDYAYLDKNGQVLANPHCYRDPRTDGAMERAFETVSREEIFEHTGLQFIQINSLYQLLADRWAGSVPLANADRFMMIPDLFHWLLSGEASNEFTDSTTT
ncbi:MAG: rhamnulokinase, partial [Thermoguttaceae bacterium]|nr:rhamnulokinase [Thermoguttaceae bacterium]